MNQNGRNVLLTLYKLKKITELVYLTQQARIKVKFIFLQSSNCGNDIFFSIMALEKEARSIIGIIVKSIRTNLLGLTVEVSNFLFLQVILDLYTKSDSLMKLSTNSVLGDKETIRYVTFDVFLEELKKSNKILSYHRDLKFLDVFRRLTDSRTLTVFR